MYLSGRCAIGKRSIKSDICNDIVRHIEIISNEEPYLKDDIEGYLKDASDEAEK